MAITPAEIDKHCFSPSKKGYDTDEVDAFLERCSSEVDAMLQKIADLKGRLTASEQQLAAAQAQIAQLQSQQPAEAAAPVTAPTGLTASETQISKVLIVAQQSADKIVSEARDNAEKIRNDADQKAREVIRQALAEKQSELDEMDRLKESREQFRDQYKALLQHFMDDADNAFSGQLSTSLPTGSAAAAQAAVSAPAAAPAFDADATQLAQPSQLPMSGVDVDDLD